MLRAQLMLGHSCLCFNGHPFEIRQSQAFKHGNEDFAWRKGCCLTAKEQELWEPWGAVSSEDVQHMKNRMRVFTCTAVLRQLRRTEPCVSCMCKWIRDKATESDGRVLTQQCVWPASLNPDGNFQVGGMAEVAQQASVDTVKLQALDAELSQLGAVHVVEVSTSDWESMATFASLLLFEKRRFLVALPHASA